MSTARRLTSKGGCPKVKADVANKLCERLGVPLPLISGYRMSAVGLPAIVASWAKATTSAAQGDVAIRVDTYLRRYARMLFIKVNSSTSALHDGTPERLEMLLTRADGRRRHIRVVYGAPECASGLSVEYWDPADGRRIFVGDLAACKISRIFYMEN